MVLHVFILCFLITQAMLESINVPLGKLKFVRGTEFQLNKLVNKNPNLTKEIIVNFRDG